MNSRMKISIIGIVFFVGVLLILLPDISEVPEEKMTSVSMAMCISDMRIDIKKDMEQGRPVKTDYKNTCPQLISKLNVDESGKIEIFNQTQQINLSFQPVMLNGKVKWSCRGTPAEFVPRACRKKPARKQDDSQAFLEY